VISFIIVALGVKWAAEPRDLADFARLVLSAWRMGKLHFPQIDRFDPEKNMR
jgi:hypothetical protein